MKKVILFILCISFLACQNGTKKQKKTSPAEGLEIQVQYAKLFSIIDHGDFKVLNVKNPWPNANKTFTYALVKKGKTVPQKEKYDAVISIPIEKIVVTASSSIPYLENLGEAKTLVGFPSLNYISSPTTRALIDAGKVEELGSNISINTERLLQLQPDAVVGFSVNGNNRTFDNIQKSGIPVIYSASWLEKLPLGKAEWIKVIGLLYGKLDYATTQFKKVERNFLEAKALVKNLPNKPSVMSGALYRDRWYIPYGNSWQGHYMKIAGANYKFKATEGEGSIALSFEEVFAKCQDADIWINPGKYTTYKQLLESAEHYKKFKAFQDKKIYTYTNVTGETGGIVYFERGPSRPDLVLKDLIKIFHPDLLPNYKLTFYRSLK